MNKHNENLIKLSKENPDLPIIPAVHYEVVQEDWGYWQGKIEKIEVDYIYNDDNSWTTGFQNIIEKLAEDKEDESDLINMNDNDFYLLIENIFNEKVKSGEIKKAIIIFIGILRRTK